MPTLPGPIDTAPSALDPTIEPKRLPARPAPQLPGAMDNAYDEAQGLYALPAPTSEVLGATAQEAFTLNPLPSASRYIQRDKMAREAAGLGNVDLGRRVEMPSFEPKPKPEILSPEQANEKYGVDWFGKKELSWDQPISEPIASELHDLKIAELRRRTILDRAEGGFTEGVARFAVGLGVSAIDPINFALAFVPVIGEARYAELLMGASSAVGRAGIRVGVGAAEGAVGSLIAEPVVYGVAKSEQADYGLADSFMNVAFGTILGGGLHMGLGAIGDRFGASDFARAVDAKKAEGGIGAIEATPDIPARTEIPETLSAISRDIQDQPIGVQQDMLRASVAEMVRDGELNATGVLAREAGIGESLRGDPGWRYSEADIEALRRTQPEIVKRSDEALSKLEAANTRLEEVQSRIASVTDAEAVSRFDDIAGQRIAEIDRELEQPIPAPRREELQREREQIVETIGPEKIQKTKNDLLIGPRKELRQAQKRASAARSEARQANRPIQQELDRISRVQKEPVRPVLEAIRERQTEPAEVAVRAEETNLQGAQRAADDITAQVQALNSIQELSPEARLVMEDADLLVSQSEAEAKAYDVALACAMRG